MPKPKSEKHKAKVAAAVSTKIAAAATTTAVYEKPTKEDLAKAAKVSEKNFIKDGKPSCFKCLSEDHTVFECSKCTKGEAKALMDRAREVWKKTKTRNI